MKIFPDKKNFTSEYKKAGAALIWAQLPADIETPTSAMLKFKDEEYSFLLESVEGGEVRGRYSIIGMRPDLIWKVSGGKAMVAKNPSGITEKFTEEKTDVFTSLRKIIKESKLDIPPELPPMASGIFGYMGYDMVRLMEKLPLKKPDKTGIPDGIMIRPTVIIIFDSVKQLMFIIVRTSENSYEKAAELIEEIKNKLKNNIPAIAKPSEDFLGDFKSNMTRQNYSLMLDKAKEYIKAGDIFQVVLSQRFLMDFPYTAFSLYRSLRRLNPSPFLFYMNFGGFQLVGSSPEILVRLRDGKVTIRPIAGTRKRGKNPAEDLKLEKELLADKKEVSEHLMLLDLGRNDVGRVAKAGTVKVTSKMKVERYSHVMHIVSNVEGELEKGLDAVDALIAGFPAGTVSGAPKIRAMEIIDELEPEKRAFYAGSVGYISANGDMDTCIALRTGLVKDGKLFIQAGGGIVYDSKPDDEFEETVNKAGALINAAKNVKEYL